MAFALEIAVITLSIGAVLLAIQTTFDLIEDMRRRK